MVVFTFLHEVNSGSDVLAETMWPESIKLARHRVGSRCGETPRMWGHCEGRQCYSSHWDTDTCGTFGSAEPARVKGVRQKQGALVWGLRYEKQRLKAFSKTLPVSKLPGDTQHITEAHEHLPESPAFPLQAAEPTEHGHLCIGGECSAPRNHTHGPWLTASDWAASNASHSMGSKKPEVFKGGGGGACL